MPGQGGDMRQFFEQRVPGGRGQPFQFRMFGPGTFLQNQQFNLEAMPSGVSVSIQKQGDQPAQITVQRGEEKWEIVGDDPASLQQLPDDLRPFVEQLLSGGSMRIPMPAMPPMPEFNVPVPPPGAPGPFDEQALRQRLEAVEKQLQGLERQLEERLHGPDTTEQNPTE
jgi:hypothetical protein